MAEGDPLFLWNSLDQVVLDLHGILLGGQAESQTEASHMSVSDNSGRDFEGRTEDDVGGLAPDSRLLV